MVRIALLGTLAGILLAPGPADAETAKVDKVRQQWSGIRAGYRRYPWQQPVKIRPKLSARELRQLGRIAKMPHISVLGNSIVGANDAYYESARIGVPLAKARMVSLTLDGQGMPFSRTLRGGVTRLRMASNEEVIQFQAPRDRPVTSPRLLKAGVYPGAKVSIRRSGSGFNAHSGISIGLPGRERSTQPYQDDYTLMAPRLTPTEKKIAPLLGRFLERNAPRLGLTTTAAQTAAADALRKSFGFPQLLGGQ